MIRTGDIYFVEPGPGDIMGHLIGWVTKGHIKHVGLVYDKDMFFEADAKWKYARFVPAERYSAQRGRFHFLRLKSMSDDQRDILRDLCRKYNDTPYSYWDCFLNLVGSPLSDKWRHELCTHLGTSYCMKCDEIVRRIVYKTTGYAPYEDSESSNPFEMFKESEASGDFDVIEWNP